MKWRLQFIPWRVCSTLLSWALYRVTGRLTWHCLTTGGLPFPQMHFRASWNQVTGRFLVSRVNSRQSQITGRYCSFTAIVVTDNGIVGIRSDQLDFVHYLFRTCRFKNIVSDSSVSHVGTDKPNDDRLGNFKKRS